jgi:chemotaxis response regulator CheB
MAKIMSIDDELRVRETICEYFHHTTTIMGNAQDGIEELEKVKQFIPDYKTL